MKFKSTHDPNGAALVGLGEAIITGLAPDGGLYVPLSLPRFAPEAFQDCDSLASIAAALLAPFFAGDPLAEDLADICEEAFDIPAPLVPIDNVEVLELFHGPTAAFKDFGARFLAACLSRVQSSEKLSTILVATSGDTGAAVAAAFHSKPGFEVIILYPEGRVSRRQAHGLECWGGNVRAMRVAGSFDDCQTLVKQALTDRGLRNQRQLLSANSINLGRWLPQAAYYAKAALQQWRENKGPLRLIIPTGNLGNAMAALLLRAAGWPIAEVVFACNANHVLPDFFASGEYHPQPSRQTIANAMDVGAPNNFERLLWLYPEIGKKDAQISAQSFSDERIKVVISAARQRYDYLPCPHTACAFALLEDMRAAGGNQRWTLCATAHPAKFETIVEPLIGTAVPIPPSIAAMLKRPATGIDLSADYADFSALLSR